MSGKALDRKSMDGIRETLDGDLVSAEQFGHESLE